MNPNANHGPTTIDLVIHGDPKPGGSKRAFAMKGRNGQYLVGRGGRPVIRIVDDAKGNQSWKPAVRRTAAVQCVNQGLREPWSGVPIHIDVEIMVRRPKHHHGTKGVLPSAPRWPVSKPDRTKLWRSTEDALRGVLYADDSQIVSGQIIKRYAEPGEAPGVVMKARIIDTAPGKGGAPCSS